MTGSVLVGGAPATGADAGAAAEATSDIPAVTGVEGAAGRTGIAWLDGLPDASRGMLSAKAFYKPGDTPEAVLGRVSESYIQAEKLIGADKIALPKDSEDAAGHMAIYDRLGRPKEPGGYLEGVTWPDGFQPAEGMADGFAAKAHELGLSVKQARALMTWNAEQAAALQQQAQAAKTEDAAQQMTALKQALGARYDATIAAGQSAAEIGGVTEEQEDRIIGAIGLGAYVDIMAKIGAGFGEAKFHAGERPNGAMSPEMARAQIQALKADGEFNRKLGAKEAAAVQEWDRLHKIAYQD